MESDDGTDAVGPAPEIALSAGDHDGDTDDDLGDDPRARWRVMPPPVRPETWVADRDPDPLPESLLAAEAEREGQARRYLVERGGGFGA
ncbi:MAG: hypothetical protein ABW212_01910 [Pseudonocardia sediminis]